ncbi:unnamed protein product [Chrysodeixis includens]|uniref:Uncharacterized protein n=1 Tax=Chrysodeixis includens TaxID=689277 RepID=A0A9N8KX05_CHRIL|nr:unnamed protein product [Chrysodeixis includens]
MSAACSASSSRRSLSCASRCSTISSRRHAYLDRHFFNLCVLWSTSCCSVVKVLVTMVAVSSSSSIFCCISTSRFLRSAISLLRCSRMSCVSLRLLSRSFPPPPCTSLSSSARIWCSSSSVLFFSCSMVDSASMFSFSILTVSSSELSAGVGRGLAGRLGFLSTTRRCSMSVRRRSISAWYSRSLASFGSSLRTGLFFIALARCAYRSVVMVSS